MVRKQSCWPMYNEKQHSCKTPTQTHRCLALYESVEAQKALEKLHIKNQDDRDVDSILDEVEDYRLDQRELTGRLGELGGMDEDAHFDDANFTAEMAMEAAGIRVDHEEELFALKCQAMLQEHWQPPPPTTHAEPRHHAEQIQHAGSQQYELPDPPGVMQAEEQGIQAVRRKAFTLQRSEY